MNEITKEMLAAADRYWAEKKEYVEKLAREHGYNIQLEDHDDEFLFAVFDGGDYEADDEEILEALGDI